MLFPPSLPVIVMGLIMSQAIDSLYVAAFLPGIVVVGIFSGYCIIHSIRQGVPSIRPSLRDMITTGYEIAPEALLIVIIFGGVFFGWMDITEVATLSLAYIIVLECLIRREVSTKGFFKASIESMTLVGALFAILASALMFANFMVDFEIPQRTLAFVQRLISNKLTFLIVLNIVLLITGALIDIFSAILVMVPLLLPIATAYGIDPIHFAVIFLWNLQIGYDTPPVGFDLFIGAARFKEPLERVWKAALPRVMVEIVGLLAITYIPAFSLWPLEALHMRIKIISF
jgi:tripartite ATP-independent transporter DctM subunit